MRAAIAQIEIKENSSGARYEGQVNQDGQQHGQGVLSGIRQGRYEGGYRNNRRHGYGTYTYRNGRIDESGIWENDKFLG